MILGESGNNNLDDNFEAVMILRNPIRWMNNFCRDCVGDRT